MVYTKDRTYKMAYTELYEVLIRLNKEQKDKLPNNFIDVVQKEMDKEYSFKYDENIGIEEQDFMVETKALIVEIYERYLCAEEEKETWEKYDQICMNKIEEKKAEQYNADNLFKNKKHTEIEDNYEIENLPVEVKKEGIVQRIINFIRNIFHFNKYE